MASKELKRGFTTGAAATAAVHAALLSLLQQERFTQVERGKVALLESATIRCLNNEWLTIPIHRVRLLSPHKAEAIVIKDAGDDPDVTHKAKIGARVSIVDDAEENGAKKPSINGQAKKISDSPSILLIGGNGVGRVTKPGLEIPPGEPAINLGPRTMMVQAVNRILERHPLPHGKAVQVEVFVPEGKLLAEKTLNARLGIVGGISILGTTGIVRPMSHDAYIATIRSGISVAQAMACDTLIFTTGRRSERFAMERFPDLPEEAFIQIGDFFKASLEAAATPSALKPDKMDANKPNEQTITNGGHVRPPDTTKHESLETSHHKVHINAHGLPPTTNNDSLDMSLAINSFQINYTQIKTVVITVFFGKAVKMAMGFPHTHAAKSELTMKTLATWAYEITGSKSLRDKVLLANTARHAFEDIYPDYFELVAHVGKMIIQSAQKFAGTEIDIRSIIFDFEGNLIFDSNER